MAVSDFIYVTSNRNNKYSHETITYKTIDNY